MNEQEAKKFVLDLFSSDDCISLDKNLITTLGTNGAAMHSIIQKAIAEDKVIDWSEEMPWVSQRTIERSLKTLKALGYATGERETQIIKGYVYLIEAIGCSRYKIGRAFNPAKRLNEMQTGSPFELAIVCIIPSDDTIRLESRLHREFAASRVKGEWFELGDLDIEYIRALASS